MIGMTVFWWFARTLNLVMVLAGGFRRNVVWGTQNESKSSTTSKSEKNALQVLGPSWADLGSFWAPTWGRKKRFRVEKLSTRAKSSFSTKVRFHNASCSELGQVGHQKGRK